MISGLRIPYQIERVLRSGERQAQRAYFGLWLDRRSPEVRCECRALLGFHAASQGVGDWLVGKHWRRECDWDPTVSEFVAIILLGRVRLGSNRRVEITREPASAVGDVSPALARLLGLSGRGQLVVVCVACGAGDSAPALISSRPVVKWPVGMVRADPSHIFAELAAHSISLMP